VFSVHLGAPESIRWIKRLDVCQALLPIRKPPICGGFHGASRTRTGDFLGAISALFRAGFRLDKCFTAGHAKSPNTFNICRSFSGETTAVSRWNAGLSRRSTSRFSLSERAKIATLERDRLLPRARSVSGPGQKSPAKPLDASFDWRMQANRSSQPPPRSSARSSPPHLRLADGTEGDGRAAVCRSSPAVAQRLFSLRL
jgi:hypothetical protein